MTASNYQLTQREYRNLKSRLTRAINSGDPMRVLREANHGLEVFASKGWPDNWARWERARDDAEYQLAQQRGHW